MAGFLQIDSPRFFHPRPSSQAGESRGCLQTAGLCVPCRALSDVDAGCVAGQTCCRRRAFGVGFPRPANLACADLQGEKGLRHVEMTHNGGILDHEIDDGFILACCSKPLSALEIEA